MKKSLLALAVLGASSAAMAQSSSVAIYGIMDLGVVSTRAAQTRIGLDSGNQSGSRLGFKGVEDLGNGMSAVFNIESGFAADTGAPSSGLLFSRRATVGLTGEFGALNLGRRNTPFWNALDAIDPMNVGFAGNAANLLATTSSATAPAFVPFSPRMDNAVIYTTPSLLNNTVVAEVAYGFGEIAGSTSASRQIGASVSYNNGPLFVTLAHHDRNNATATDKVRNTILGAKYDFTAAILHLALTQNKGTAAADSRDWLLGVTLPLGGGQHKIMASYIRKDDRAATNADGKQYALAYTYDFSKRTNLYASYAKITNDNGAAYLTNARFGDREANVGIRHKF